MFEILATTVTVTLEKRETDDVGMYTTPGALRRIN